MARHSNNNSHNVQLRELYEEDELQGYDVKNAKRSKKKKSKQIQKVQDVGGGQLLNWTFLFQFITKHL